MKFVREILRIIWENDLKSYIRDIKKISNFLRGVLMNSKRNLKKPQKQFGYESSLTYLGEPADKFQVQEFLKDFLGYYLEKFSEERLEHPWKKFLESFFGRSRGLISRRKKNEFEGKFSKYFF